MPSFIQSSTQKGIVNKVATSDLTGKEGLFAKLVDATGAATASLAGAGEQALFVIVDGGNATKLDVALQPLTAGQNVRVIANATLAGGVEVQSDGGGKAVVASTGSWVLGITEEDAVAGQYALLRPVLYKK